MKKEIKTFKELATFINPNRVLGEEGVDYINVHIHSKSRVGKMLAPEYVQKFNTPFGPFLSVSNYWMWLNGGQDDRIRFIHPKNLKKAIREQNLNTSVKRRKLYYFKELIAHAKFTQLNKPYCRNILVDQAEDLNKVLTMFTEREGFRTTLPYADWYLKSAKEAAIAVIQGDELYPDITEKIVHVTAEELGFVNFQAQSVFEEQDEDDIDQQLVEELSKDLKASEEVAEEAA